MIDYQPYKRGTVLAPTGPCEHLHVVCNDPVYYPINGCDCVLVVNISSCKEGVPFDATCLLKPGDHDFIRHDSYVVYREAIIWRVPNVISRVQTGEIIPRSDVSFDVFKRINAGFGISEQVIPKNFKFWRTFCSNY
ncbi:MULTISPECIES: hypothetical protein [Proteus]|uniref:Uncharacterized protein n=1 Tax=Proteus penneri TaxID=102862 RepID=A0A0G4QEB6_9GAMM|nr:MULTISPECIES: hypothetical protein [Proteus]AYY81064.1 hypothetical protein EGX81_09280 [Proteus vulgaris]AYY81154.1 hypothetical protein EGX81_09785 [Proteus vulgaris]AYY82117.1 hypothetical protein EGX81_15055 [Proteus vulgaris]MBJ2118974.1 hypothetical protein [Proteus penneri]NBN74152.1 hypothetical protein [Proteus sp. G2615]